MKQLDAKIPPGRLEEKWDYYLSHSKLINRVNKQKLNIIVVGAGLAGGSAAATLAEQGYNVQCFCFQDSTRRAHSVAAQGGINAAKDYQNDGDSVWRMFYDTLKGGDFRSREANVYRLAQLSGKVIDHLNALGVPFAREYGGYLCNRSFGGVQVKRTFYARGQTGQQLLLGTCSQLAKMEAKGQVQTFTRHEIMDIVLIDGRARGVIARDLITGELKRYGADAVVLASGGYSRVYRLSTLAIGCNGSAIWKAFKKGACFANPSFTQIHPTALPQSNSFQSKLTLMSESLRNDGRIWVPKKKDETRSPNQIPEMERDYYLERRYPSYGNLTPRDLASRAAKERIDKGFGVGPLKNAVYLDFKHAIQRVGKKVIQERYGNLFDMYKSLKGIDAYESPMMISPAAHFSMGGLWVDYELMTSIPGLYALGECNFSDHGAKRLGANSLLQACVDGYFILPNTINNFLSQHLHNGPIDTSHSAFDESEHEVRKSIDKILSVKGKMTVNDIHIELGEIMWNLCGMDRWQEGLDEALVRVKRLKELFWQEIHIPGDSHSINQELEKGLRLADFLELAELICEDARNRQESCGAHFRREFQTPDGEAMRDDQNFSFVSAWYFQDETFREVKEPLNFEFVTPISRSYK